MTFVSQIEPRNIDEALHDEHWLLAIHDELNQFKRNEVWDLVVKPTSHKRIGTKWVVRNKLDESGIIVKKKVRLAAKGYNQEKALTMIRPMTLLVGWMLLDCYMLLLV